MRSLYLRIWLTVVASLALFALVTGWLVQRHFDQERERFVASAQERAAAWGELLPTPSGSRESLSRAKKCTPPQVNS